MRSWVIQPIGMTPSMPFQYIQKAAVVLAAAAVETASPPMSITPPPKLTALHVSGLGTLAPAARGVSAPVGVPLWVPAASTATPDIAQASLKSHASIAAARAPALTVTLTTVEVAVAPRLSVTLAVSAYVPTCTYDQLKL